MVWEAVIAAQELEKQGISVDLINIHTIKPLDTQAIINSVKKTKCAVSAEEHLKNNGLGDSIAQVLAQHIPTPLEYVAVNDKFGESGKPADLMKKYGLDAEHIVIAAKKAIERKNQK